MEIIKNDDGSKIIKYSIKGRNKIAYLNSEDRLHRIGGCALEYDDGSGEWWLDGIRYKKNEYKLKNRELTIKKILKNG